MYINGLGYRAAYIFVTESSHVRKYICESLPADKNYFTLDHTGD